MFICIQTHTHTHVRHESEKEWRGDMGEIKKQNNTMQNRTKLQSGLHSGNLSIQ